MNWSEKVGMTLLTVGVLLALVLATLNVKGCSDCWDRGGQWVRGMSATGYVCVPGK